MQCTSYILLTESHQPLISSKLTDFVAFHPGFCLTLLADYLFRIFESDPSFTHPYEHVV